AHFAATGCAGMVTRCLSHVYICACRSRRRLPFHLSAFFFFQCCGHNRDLHSFPTRRSSDLIRTAKRMATAFRADWTVVAVEPQGDRKSTRLNSSHLGISYAVFCLKKKKKSNFRPVRA